MENNENPKVSTVDDDYSEVMLSIRHYSTLRFAILTLFSTTTAGLTVGHYGDYETDIPKPLIPAAGILLTLTFLWLEVTLDAYMETFSKVAKSIKPLGHWSLKSERLSSLVKIPLLGLYALVSCFWLWVLFKSLFH